MRCFVGFCRFIFIFFIECFSLVRGIRIDEFIYRVNIVSIIFIWFGGICMFSYKN